MPRVHAYLEAGEWVRCRVEEGVGGAEWVPFHIVEYAVVHANVGYAAVHANVGYAAAHADVGYADVGYAAVHADVGYAAVHADAYYAVVNARVAFSSHVLDSNVELGKHFELDACEK